MSVHVIVPFGGTDPTRIAARDFVLDWLDTHHDWPVTLAEIPDPWCKGRAVNPIAAASDASTLIVHDADSVVMPDKLEAIVEQIRTWGAPYSTVRRLKPEPTSHLLAGAELDPRMPADHHAALPGGGIVAIRRESWETVRGFDCRFVGWGGEDHSLNSALTALVGTPWRLHGPLYHLWHDSTGRAASTATRSLNRRYLSARFDKAAMSALIREEGHDAV